MYKYILIILTAFMIAGCGDEFYGSDNGTGSNGAIKSNKIERDPSISPDREYIYYISEDTLNSQYSGIYRMRIDQPIRENILGGTSYCSPSVDTADDKVAFLDNGMIKYFDISSSEIINSDITDIFNSAVLIDDDLIMASRSEKIYRASEETGNSFELYSGKDPVVFAPDSFVYVDYNIVDNINYIIMQNKHGLKPETLYVRQYDQSGVRIRWPSYDSESNRLVFGVDFGGQKYIYSYEVGDHVDSLNFIDSSNYTRSVILDFNRIVYTNIDGRFYLSDFFGENKAPFVHVER